MKEFGRMSLSALVAMMLMIIGLPLLQSVPAASAQSPVVPLGILAYVPITIANSQTSPTPAGFQQLVSVDSAAYAGLESPNLENIEFFSSDGTIIPSWLESGNSSGSAHTVYWLNLRSPISGGSDVTVYMGFASKASNLFNNTAATGEAPQLSPVYGEHDDGASVFLYYTGFAGSSLPAGWSSHPALHLLTNVSYSVNNGLTFPPQPACCGSLDYERTYGNGTMIDVDATITGQAPGSGSYGAIVGYRLLFERGQTYWGVAGLESSDHYTLQTCYVTACVYVVSNKNYTSGTPVIGTIGFNGTNVVATNDYGTYVTNSSDVNIFPASPSIQQGSSNLSLFVQWLRVRLSPPSGVMPSVAFGSLPVVLTTTTTTKTVTSNQTATTTQTQTATNTQTRTSFIVSTTTLIEQQTLPTTLTETSLVTSYTTVVSSGDLTQNAVVLALLVVVSFLAGGEAIYIMYGRRRRLP